MITLHDIETAIVERLMDAGHTVTAEEIKDGFDKPSFFIDIFQNSVTAQNPFMELVSVSVELKYLPDTPTREVLVKMADELSPLFTNEALKVQDRFLTIQEVTFDTENNNLLTYFDLEFMREREFALTPGYEKMGNLELEV